MKIEKKIWPKFFKEIKFGKKNFELRLANWKCKPGDILILREWNPKIKKYTGKVIEKQVGYVLKTKNVKFWNKNDIDKYGFQVIAFK